VQDKFNISPERLNKMVKEWDKTKIDSVGSHRSTRKKKAKDTGTLGVKKYSKAACH
jgi:striatin 1/3/4